MNLVNILRSKKFPMGPISIMGLYFVLTLLGCDNKSKVEDRTGTRRDGANVVQKNKAENKSSDDAEANDDEDLDEESHDHPIYEKEKPDPRNAKDPVESTPSRDPVPTPTPVTTTPTTPAPPAPPTTPVTPPTPVPPPPPPAPKPTTDPEEARLKAMYDAKKMVTTVMIDATGPDPQSDAIKWFSSPAKPITCYAAVDAAGALVVPAGVGTKQIPSGTAAAPGNTTFKGANNVDVATLHSSCQICNKTGAALYLHSGNTGPFSHGGAAFADGTCVQFLLERLTATAGSTYDHAKGSATNSVAFKIVKIGPDGKVVP